MPSKNDLVFTLVADDQTEKTFTKVKKNIKGMENASRTATRNMRAHTAQLGYQIQDIAVQLQGGQNALMVLGQQGSQIASVFGVWGSVAGAALAVLSAGLYAATKDGNFAKKSMEDLTEAMSEADRVTRTLADGQRVLNQEFVNLAKSSVAVAEIRLLSTIQESKDLLDETRLLAEGLSERNWLGNFASEVSPAKDAVEDFIQAFGRFNDTLANPDKYVAFNKQLNILQDRLLETAEAAGVSVPTLNELQSTFAALSEDGSADNIEAFAVAFKNLAQETGDAGLLKFADRLGKAFEEANSLEEAITKMNEALADLPGELKKTETATSNKVNKDKELIATLQLEYELLKLSTPEREIEEKLRKLSAKATDEQKKKVKELVTQIEAEKAAQKALNEQLKKAESLRNANKKALEAEVKVYERAADTLAKKVEQERFNVESIGLTKFQTEQLEIAKLNDVLATKEQELADLHNVGVVHPKVVAALEAEIGYLKELIGLKESGSIKRASVEAAEKAEQEWSKAAKSLEEDISDAIMRGFENGESFIDSFKNAVQNAFKTMVLQPLISPIAGFGATLQTGFSPAAGLAGTGINPFQQIGQKVIGDYLGFNDLGGQLLDVGKAALGIGGSIGATAGLSTGIGGSAAISGSLGAGAGIGTGIGGSAAAATAGSSLSSSLAALAANPATWIAGGLLLFGDSLFGKKPSAKAQWGQFQPDGNLSLTGGQTGNKFSQENRDLADQGLAFVEALNSSINNFLPDAIAEGFITLVAKNKHEGVSVYLSDSDDFDTTSTTGRTQAWYADEDAVNYIAKNIETAEEFLDASAEGLLTLYGLNVQMYRDLAKDAEELGVTFERVESALAITSNAAELLDFVLSGNERGIRENAVAFTEAFETVEQLSASLESLVVPPTFTELWDSLNDAFSDLDLSLPASADELRSLVEGYEITDAASAEYLASLLQLAPAYVQAETALNNFAQSVLDILNPEIINPTTFAEKYNLTDKFGDAVPRSILDWFVEGFESGGLDFSSKVATYLDDLGISTDEFTSDLAELKRAFEEIDKAAVDAADAAADLAAELAESYREGLLDRLNRGVAQEQSAHDLLVSNFETAKANLIGAIGSKITGIQGTIGNLRSRQSDYRSDISNLNASIRAKQAEIRAQESAINAAQRLAETWRDLADELRNSAKEIIRNSLSDPAAIFDIIQQQFNTVLQSAFRGNQDSIKQLPGIATDLQEAGRNQFSTAAEFELFSAQLAAQLDSVAGISDVRASEQERIAAAAERQIDLLTTSIVSDETTIGHLEAQINQIDTQIELAEKQIEQFQQQIDVINGVEQVQMSIADAQAAFDEAQQELEASNHVENIEALKEQINILNQIDTSLINIADLLAESRAYTAELPQFSSGGIASGPASGYPVELHGTEAVIPLNGGSIPVQVNNSELVAEIRSLREDIRAGNFSVASNTKETTKLMKRWETVGMPLERAV